MNVRRRAVGAVVIVATAALLGGCAAGNAQQSILDPQGERAQSVDGLWTLMLWIGAAVWVLTTVALVLALVRRRSAPTSEENDDEDDEDRRDRRPFWLVATVGAIVPGIIVGALTFVSAGVLLHIDPDQEVEGPLIEVTAHQYWWEVRYPELAVTTANEIHIPAGERVRIELTSDDVIHSFWVPQLSGKMDTIPGQTNTLWIAADRPGTYWGQCAEYCGADHALMRMLVIAHDEAEFEGWVAAQRLPAPTAPAEEPDADVARGREIFMSSSCVYCHAIDGTAAQGDVGPDLTHLASRETIAAGLLPNDRGNLGGWVLDPQSIKPGNLMPGTDFDGEDLQYLLDYLESLE